jgi:DNA modification methylase
VKQLAKSAPFQTAEPKFPLASVLAADARNMPLLDSTVDAIVTSPPYLNAIDYVRGHKLSLVWMGHSVSSLRLLRSTNVGTEVGRKLSESGAFAERIIGQVCSGAELGNRHKGMLRQYVEDLRLLLRECHRVLKPGAKAVFVIGDCNLRESFVENSTAIDLIGRDVGFRIGAARRRPLPENRRYLPPPTTKSSGKALQKRMKEEIILTLVKEAKVR